MFNIWKCASEQLESDCSPGKDDRVDKLGRAADVEAVLSFLIKEVVMQVTLHTVHRLSWDGYILGDEEGWIYIVDDDGLQLRKPDFVERFAGLCGPGVSFEEVTLELEKIGIRLANPSDAIAYSGEENLVMESIGQLQEGFVQLEQRIEEKFEKFERYLDVASLSRGQLAQDGRKPRDEPGNTIAIEGGGPIRQPLDPSIAAPASEPNRQPRKRSVVPADSPVADYWEKVSEERKAEFRNLLKDKGIHPSKDKFSPKEVAVILGLKGKTGWTVRYYWCYEGTIEARKNPRARRGRNELWEIHISAIIYYQDHGPLPRKLLRERR